MENRSQEEEEDKEDKEPDDGKSNVIAKLRGEKVGGEYSE